tara:strand:- start:379 stop:648 length:270 start_codon:yes stop_codon:yes gene_type:complete
MAKKTERKIKRLVSQGQRLAGKALDTESDDGRTRTPKGERLMKRAHKKFGKVDRLTGAVPPKTKTKSEAPDKVIKRMKDHARAEEAKKK